MKFALEERVKHRLIGLAVIISLAAIFAPAIMKKSHQRFDNEIGMHIPLPPKPDLPKVAVADSEKLFKTVKVAHVELPAVRSQPITELAKVEKQIPLEAIAAVVDKNLVTSIPSIAKAKTAPVELSEKTLALASKLPEIPAATIAKKPIVLALNQEIYSVQLASFGRLQNAQVLVNRLRAKGYTGKIVKVSTKHGDQFKVFVGKSNNKAQALKLKNQLAQSLRLNGFVVNKVG